MTDAHALDERQHAEALKAAINARLTPHSTFEYGAVPGLNGNAGTHPSIYALVQVERRSIPTRSAVRRATRTGWRASIRAVGRTPNETRWASQRIAEALDGTRLTVGGFETTPVEHETSDAPALDADRFESLTRYVYAL